MKKLLLCSVILLALSCSKDNDGDNGFSDAKWISEIIEYAPAPGQFINTNLGNVEAALGIVGKKGNDVVSLGGFGGYIVFKFNHRVKNLKGTDFVILGNAFDNSSEPGGVMVSVDSNGNGKADDEWFELKGSEYDKSIKDYEITYTRPTQTAVTENIKWTDNQKGSGALEALPGSHNQCYFPLFIKGEPATLTFKGTLAPANNKIEDDLWVLSPFGSGYVDNYSADYNEIVGGDKETKGGNKFDIDNAIDATGKSVSLREIDFIKVYSCTNSQSGDIGEASTEIRGAISLSAK